MRRSQVSEASDVLAALKLRGIVSERLEVEGDLLRVRGGGTLKIPGRDGATGWRRVVNSSLLPRSISAESRRHLLYAVLQDLVAPEILLHHDGTSAGLLTRLGPEYTPFEPVYRVPGRGSSERTVVYPVHVAVPIVFDTYRRAAAQRQTDKGFRGPFLEFFSCDNTGQQRDEGLGLVLQDLFARTSGLSALDMALVKSLSTLIAADRAAELRTLISQETLPVARAGEEGERATEAWKRLYQPSPAEPGYRPLPPFAEQGSRLRLDIQAIACAAGVSRIQRIAMVERLLAYHFATYLVRLSDVLYGELARASELLACHSASGTPWQQAHVGIRYRSKTLRTRREWGRDYEDTMNRLNEAYLMLPVLNNIELAIRAAATTADQPPVPSGALSWAEALELTGSFSADRLASTREVAVFLAALGSAYVNVPIDQVTSLVSHPVEALFNAVRLHYTDASQRRYPRDHHQLVFEGVADQGPASFIQRRPVKHFTLGDEFIFLLVLTMFEHRDPDDRVTSTATPRTWGALRRHRMPLRQLEERLQEDLIVPADDSALEDLRNSLARLGLLDRLSDVGEANFLRHPIGV
jgi:hypothetical protein